ncbi:MAG: outer membrane beta-barrel family protein [Bacteroidales bacterium]|nr:outer membrane beta-barrel family protein [Bacteroidales bacterium]
MRPRVSSILCLLFLLSGTGTLRAQWTTGGDVSGGYWYKYVEQTFLKDFHHGLGSGSVWVQYDKPAFMWKTTVNGQYERNSEDSFRFEFDLEDPDVKDFRTDRKTMQSTLWNLGVKSEFKWTPVPGQCYEAWLQYGYDDKISTNTVMHEEDIQDDVTSLSIEVPDHRGHKASQGFSSYHELGSNRLTLLSEVLLEESWIKDDIHWTVTDSFDATDYIKSMDTSCSFMPRSRNYSLRANLHLRDTVLTGSRSRGMVDPGVRTRVDAGHDLYGGSKRRTLEELLLLNTVPQDSSEFAQHFKSRILTVEPYVATTWVLGPFTVSADYGLRFYSRAVSDAVTSTRKAASWAYVVGRSSLDWKLSEQHTLSLSSTMDVSQPATTQLLWEFRQGSDLSTLVIGNPELKACRNRSYVLSHKSSVRRFSTTLEAGFTRSLDEIDRTFLKMIIKDGEYKVFSWVNSSDSWAFRLYELLGWEGDIVRAHVGIQYNQIRRWKKDDGKQIDSHNWRTWADARVVFGRGWVVAADALYRSRVNTVYTSIDDYWTLNFRIEKNFRKWSLYLEGRDLLDNLFETSYLSADGLSGWTVMDYKNWRMIVLGFKWNI